MTKWCSRRTRQRRVGVARGIAHVVSQRHRADRRPQGGGCLNPEVCQRVNVPETAHQSCALCCPPFLCCHPRRDLMVAGETAQERTAMFVEQRIYSFAPGDAGQFLKTYESDAFAAQTQAPGQPVGYYVNEIGPLNQITTMWAYGSLDERVERRRNLVQRSGLAGIPEKVPAADDRAGDARFDSGAVLPGTSQSHRVARGNLMTQLYWPASWRWLRSLRPPRRRRRFRHGRSSSSCRWRPAAASTSPRA